MYPRGATLDVVPPAAAVLATGRLLHPPQCPVCARPRGPVAAALSSCSLRCGVQRDISSVSLLDSAMTGRHGPGALMRFPGRTAAANQPQNPLLPPRARCAPVLAGGPPWAHCRRMPWHSCSTLTHTCHDPHSLIAAARRMLATNAARAPGGSRASCALGQIL